MRTYEEIIYQIENTHRFKNTPGVEVTQKVLKEIGNPFEKLPFIHVAGTNGKGSVCAFLTSILSECGLKVGTFTSPHLSDFRERIRVNGQMIPAEAVTRLGNMLLDGDYGVSLTMFDYCLAMASLYFAEAGCDIAVIETGLGGRLDSTNALGTPALTVITRIGLDHMAILGDDIESIAREKAGIIKSGTAVVTCAQEPAAARVIEEAVRQVDVFSYTCVGAEQIDAIRDVSLRMIGEYQKENAAVAAAGVEALVATGVLEKADVRGNAVDLDSLKSLIRRGLEKAVWPGRMELVSKEPFLLIDGAHNGNGVAALAGSLKALYPDEKFDFYFAVMADKDYEEMVECILPLARSFATVTANSDRAMQADALAEFIASKGIEVKAYHNVDELLDNISDEGKNVAFGSLYFIGELREKACRRLGLEG